MKIAKEISVGLIQSVGRNNQKRFPADWRSPQMSHCL